MAMVRIKIVFNMKEFPKTFIETDVKTEEIKEVLCAFVQGQAGEGVDESKANILDIYTIDIILELSDDSFRIVSDTGNKGLTCGIVMQTMKVLDVIDIRPLS